MYMGFWNSLLLRYSEGYKYNIDGLTREIEYVNIKPVQVGAKLYSENDAVNLLAMVLIDQRCSGKEVTVKFDVAVAIGFALLFFMLVFSSLMTLYLRHFWLFGVVICFNIFLPTRLRMSRQTLARNRERRLPLSI
ncbi:hypothetical protein D0Y65_029188 [Glycine soja]|uniref:Uncharacterized protein n=1 Tax=Glycine soja TaxID=3848 RepID=A0A445HY05_GLYSO|nr:hypothetical protein D0Y65_029188 [Glycine soja]